MGPQPCISQLQSSLLPITVANTPTKHVSDRKLQNPLGFLLTQRLRCPLSLHPSFDQRSCALASAPPHLCQSQTIARPSGFSAHPKSSDQALQGVLHLRTLRNQKYPSCSTVTWEPAPAPLASRAATECAGPAIIHSALCASTPATSRWPGAAFPAPASRCPRRSPRTRGCAPVGRGGHLAPLLREAQAQLS